ncbi:phosphoribosylanthranilate isomerase [Acetitomaculum ruminis DSM 5522]|uniref:N-(5'-phosphoribosyl)anthranilate isomerase n=1 Tax=Acetitomaculum ruminis DSM 5522 TaxID=1120918 RepID=A0A1I0YM82_9FIRM|nr:phosphoribosylanthranilate isomerase [Acetitomaculum ruminis]SFB13906.1 phosphoribosylanthranilate isomerase [Acetitomaculum ruminis DSM 5522]
MTGIKICGLTCLEDANTLNKTRPDYAGFVFYEKSKRNLSYLKAKEIMNSLYFDIKKVAVVVSPNVKELKIIEEMGFDILQIHGECPKEIFEKAEIPIWLATNINKEIPEIKDHEKIAGYLFDGAKYGGGKPFDWEIAKKIREKIKEKRFILAGGLDEENVNIAINTLHPDIVDVSSSVEKETKKDEKKVLKFVRKVRENG